MIKIKTEEEITEMKKAGKKSKEVLDFALSLCTVGRTTIEIDKAVEKKMEELSVTPWFKEVDDYKYSTCISVNEVWLHGIPGNYKLKKDDVVSIDLGIKYNDLYVDNCWTCVVYGNKSSSDVRNQFEHSDSNIKRFLEEGVKCLHSSIDKFKAGNRVGDISAQMGNYAESKGYSVIDDFVGHGIGRFYHEDPPIPCYGVSGAGPLLKKRMVLAIELMYTVGGYEHSIADDGWTVVTSDRKISAMFEHTVALDGNDTVILTA